MNSPYSVTIEVLGAEHFADHIGDMLERLCLDLLPVLVKQVRMHVGPGPDKSVDGAENLVVGLEFDAVPLDLKLRAALRAGGFDLDCIGHDGVSAADVTVAAKHEGAAIANVAAPDRDAA